VHVHDCLRADSDRCSVRVPHVSAPEPARRRFNAIMVAGAGAAYLSSGHGFGPWEFVFTAAVTYCAYRGLDSYVWTGVAWLLHAAWDILHYLRGAPIIPFASHSSFGCAICDPAIAIWCMRGGPSLPGSDQVLVLAAACTRLRRHRFIGSHLPRAHRQRQQPPNPPGPGAAARPGLHVCGGSYAGDPCSALRAPYCWPHPLIGRVGRRGLASGHHRPAADQCG
jgi:hypothetical protein